MRRALPALMLAGVLMSGGVAEAHETPYGPAGCGIGHMIVGNDAGIVQILAMTLNNFAGNQTLGITFGTLGCDVSGGAGAAAAFIQTNRPALAKDIARGSGETIEGLAVIAGCTDAGAVGSVLQSEYQSIFPDAMVSDHAVTHGVISALQSHGELQCGELS